MKLRNIVLVICLFIFQALKAEVLMTEHSLDFKKITSYCKRTKDCKNVKTSRTGGYLKRDNQIILKWNNGKNITVKKMLNKDEVNFILSTSNKKIDFNKFIKKLNLAFQKTESASLSYINNK